MKNRFFVIVLLLCVVATFVAGTAEAQNKRTGTAAASELLIPVGARGLAMGGSTISSASGVEAIHWNPAGLGTLKGSAEGMFSSMSYIADVNVSYGAVGASFGEFGAVGLSIRSLDFGEIPLTTNADPEGKLGRMFSPTFVTLGLTYARALSDQIAAGFTAKLISESIERVSATGFALDFGVQYHGLVGVKGLQLGIAIKNIGPQMQYDGSGLLRNALSSDGLRPEQLYKSEAAAFELPSLIELGVGYTDNFTDEFSYNVNGSFANDNLHMDNIRMGGEVMYKAEDITLFGRAGGSFFWDEVFGKGAEKDAAKEGTPFGASFGFGINYTTPGLDITLDYAFRQSKYFSNNSVFSLKLGF